MLLRAYAKINLDLRILGRRADGYHEVCTVLQTIDWHDEIRMDPSDGLEFVAHGAPGDDSNLVLRAVREFERLTGKTVRARIELTKNVPIGAGLGGGSADAAVTVLGLVRLHDGVLSDSDLQVCLRALGSDVPFFAVGGRAVGVGRGDEVSALSDEADYWLVVVDPGIPISTHEAYSWLTVPNKSNSIGGFGGQFVAGHEGRNDREPKNDFESVVFEHYPTLESIKTALLESGARRASLSGSGSAVFAMFDSESRAAQAALDVADRGTVRVTRPLTRVEYLQRVFGR